MTSLPKSRHKAVIRKSNIALSVNIIMRFEFLPPGGPVCNGGTAVVGLLHNTEDSDTIDPCHIDDGRRKFQNWKNGK